MKGHLIYGTITDCMTGQTLIDTDDERIRQSLYAFVMNEKGYAREDLRPRVVIESCFDGRRVVSTIDLLFSYRGCEFMVLRYGAGSLVSRYRTAVAAARVICPHHQLPLAIVTNGQDAELLDTITGKSKTSGLDSIPSAADIEEIWQSLQFLPAPVGKRAEFEYRVLNAFDFNYCRNS